MDRIDDPNDPNNDEADAIDPNEIRGTVPEIDETDHLVSRALRENGISSDKIFNLRFEVQLRYILYFRFLSKM